MNEYQIAIIVGGGVLLAWLCAYLFSWVVQLAWAFIDDNKASKRNWLETKVNFSKYKYPVYNEWRDEGLEKAIADGEEPHKYSKNKADKNKKARDVDSDNCKYGFNRAGGIFTVSALSSLVPLVAVFSFNFYPVALFIVTLLSVIYITRMIVRGKKLFNKHVADKDAHKE